MTKKAESVDLMYNNFINIAVKNKRKVYFRKLTRQEGGGGNIVDP